MVVGPWDSADVLANGGAAISVQLANPEDGGETYVLIDQVVYQTTDPWPAQAGRALQRVSESAFGSGATSWNLDVPSPGEYGSTIASDGDACQQ